MKPRMRAGRHGRSRTRLAPSTAQSVSVSAFDAGPCGQERQGTGLCPRYDWRMRIRCAVESDTGAIIAPWREGFPEYDDPPRPQRDPRASIARKLSFGEGLFWLAENDER